MATANKLYFDAAVRHQVAVRRFASGEVKDILSYLEGADRELTTKLRERLAALTAAGKAPDFTSRRWKALLADVKAARKEALATVKGNLTSDLQGFAKVEVATEQAMLKSAIPFEVGFASVDMRQLRAIVTTHPFAGHPLGDWFSGLAAADQASLVGSIRMGMVQGESIPDIMKRVAGTAENGWADGALAATRRKTEAVVRTAVNSVSNEARTAMWEANSDIISCLRWTSTLDGRTTPICMARDGMLAALDGKELPDGVSIGQTLMPPSARPPAHVNCRSVMVAVIDGVGVLGARPYVRDTRRPEAREVDFRAEAKRTGRPIADIRKEWADQNIGQVPAEMTYNDWLRGQPEEFQNDVLGPSRAAIFRTGQVDLDSFVDHSGKLLTLKDLEGVGIVEPKPRPTLASVLKPGTETIAATATADEFVARVESWSEDARTLFRQIKGGDGSAVKARTAVHDELKAKIHEALTLPDVERMKITPNIDPNIPAENKGMVDKAADFFSKVASNKAVPFEAKVDVKLLNSQYASTRSGGCASGVTLSVNDLKRADIQSVIVHEFGHVIEDRYDDKLAMRKFLLDRAAAQPNGGIKVWERYGSFQDQYGRKWDELIWKDKFRSEYVGKIYVNGAGGMSSDKWVDAIKDARDLYGTEVLSMGIQWMYDSPYQFLHEDPEMFKVVFNFLRGRP